MKSWRVADLPQVWDYSLVFITTVKQQRSWHESESATLCFVFNAFPELEERGILFKFHTELSCTEDETKQGYQV